jgi:hypothetical protein
MPNNVINEVVFQRPASEHTAILAKVCNAEGKVDFEVLVPMPAQIWRGSVGRIHTDAFGAQNIGLDWARLNWGTKWNAYGHKPVEADADSLTIRFQTAWAPPYPWLVALFNTCGEFRHNWLDEGRSDSFTGLFSVREHYGDSWQAEQTDEVLHRHLHKLLWGVEEFTDEGDEVAA